MKHMRKVISLFTVCSIFLCNLYSVSATSPVDSEIEETNIQYSVGTYSLNGIDKECVVETRTTYSPLTEANSYEVVCHTVYYLPITAEQESMSNQIISNIKDNDQPTLRALRNTPPHTMDPWYECEYHIETQGIYSTEPRVEIGPGEFDSVTYVGITKVLYGYYTYRDGDGRVSLENAIVRIYQSGHTSRTQAYGADKMEEFVKVINGPFHVADLEHLNSWSPQGWKQVAMIFGSHVGAYFEGTAINDKSGQKFNFSISSILYGL